MIKRCNFGSSGSLSSMSDGVLREITWIRTLLIVSGLVFLALFAGLRSPTLPANWLLGGTTTVTVEDMSMMEYDQELRWNSWITRADEWQKVRAVKDGDQNWEGRQRLQKQRANGSLWWDEKAADFFTNKLEASQYPADCSKAHWLAHYDYVAGLLSSVHIFQVPLFFAMVRGNTLVPVAQPKRSPLFDGCGTDNELHSMQCYFNVTTCVAHKDETRWEKIQAVPIEKHRISWEEILLKEDEGAFPEAGVTVIQTWRGSWDDKVCVDSSNFESSRDAHTYYKHKIWDDMGRHGKVGFVNPVPARGLSKNCYGYKQDSKSRRLDMVMTALMSSWLLNHVPEAVRMVADSIMSRYADEFGRPLWQAPVLGIHVRQTDKSTEDPYYQRHGSFRPIEDYALQMKDMEKQYGFEWPSIFILSDSGTALETLIGVINGNSNTNASDARALNENSTSADAKQSERYIMYDWTSDEHLQDKYQKHSKVPPELKHDMQIHFLATLYIMQKIADHAIVTYSSNVGRFIGEVMAAKQGLAYAEPAGPLVTSLDYPYFWN